MFDFDVVTDPPRRPAPSRRSPAGPADPERRRDEPPPSRMVPPSDMPPARDPAE
jgi:hypothetical protein